jgi:flagellar protein FliO/FliZ
MPSSGLTVLWFVGIVAMIPLTLWALKRSGLATGAMGAAAQALIKPVAQLNIGPGQRLVTVEVGEGDDKKWLVLGVTAQQISTLHTMAPQAHFNKPAGGASAFAPASFSALLRRTVGHAGQPAQPAQHDKDAS